LHDRDLSTVVEPHVGAIHMARAAIIRAAIGTIMAVVDKPGRDRASIGQVVQMFERTDLSILASRWSDPMFGPAELQRAKDDWAALLATDEFQSCKDFRDGRIGHTLVLEPPAVPNEAYFRVLEAAENITRRFHRIAGYGTPDFSKHRPALIAKAKVFWDTYFKGMSN
jgi:hypothetical protein